MIWKVVMKQLNSEDFALNLDLWFCSQGASPSTAERVMISPCKPVFNASLRDMAEHNFHPKHLEEMNPLERGKGGCSFLITWILIWSQFMKIMTIEAFLFFMMQMIQIHGNMIAIQALSPALSQNEYWRSKHLQNEMTRPRQTIVLAVLLLRGLHPWNLRWIHMEP